MAKTTFHDETHINMIDINHHRFVILCFRLLFSIETQKVSNDQELVQSKPQFHIFIFKKL